METTLAKLKEGKDGMRPKMANLGKIALLLFKGILLLLFVVLALAQEPHRIDLALDPAATKVQWTLGDVLHTVHGNFRMKQGVIHYNPGTGEASGLIEIDAMSGESGSPARDERMHSNILDSAKYRTITFRPTHVEGKFDQGVPSSFSVGGIFSLHGHDHPMKISVSSQPKSDGVTFQTHFEVPYVDWGLRDPSTFVLRVSKNVSIDIDTFAKVLIEPDAKAKQ